MLVETVPTLKKQQTTQEDCKDGMKLCRGKIRKAKAQLEFSLTTARKDDKKCVYKYINKKGGLRRIFIHYWNRSDKGLGKG